MSAPRSALSRRIFRSLTRIANSRTGRTLTGWIFAHMSFLIPVQRLCETDTLIAFHHPEPSHAFHVLLVPRQAIASLSCLGPPDAAFLSDLVRTVQELVEQFKLPAYRLIVNGGDYQEFPQLHFHLISDEDGPAAPERPSHMPPAPDTENP